MALNLAAAHLGSSGEEFACRYLQERRFEIVERNWRIKEGEIDIVARTSEGLFVFIEVKTRRSAAYGDPLESISRDKAMRLQRLALAWLATHHRLGDPYRIDAMGLILGRSGSFIVDHREGVL